MLTWLCVSVIANAALVIVAAYFWLKKRGADALLQINQECYDRLWEACNQEKRRNRESVSRRLATCNRLAEIRSDTSSLLADMVGKQNDT